MRALKQTWRGVAICILGACLLLGGHVGPAQALKVQTLRTPGGIDAWLVEERALPIVTLVAAFDGGMRLETKGQEGIATLLSYLFDEGAGAMASRAFMTALEDRAINFTVRARADEFTFGVSALKENFPEAARLSALALTKPRFDSDPVRRMKETIRVARKETNDNPQSAAALAWWEMAFPGTSYGRSANGTEASVGGVTQGDLRAFHARALTRGKMKVILVGDATPTEAATYIDTMLGALPAKGPVIDQTDLTLAPAQIKIVKRDVPQSVIVFGLPGVKRDHPDFRALHILNHILAGGDFTSRLMQEIRVKRGLTYGVSASLTTYEHTGVWVGRMATKNESAGEALKVLKDELARVRDTGVTAEELADAKTYLTGSYALAFDSNSNVASQLLTIALDGKGPDYADKRNQEVEAVTLADVNRVAKTYMDPGRLVTLVLGDPKGL